MFMGYICIYNIMHSFNYLSMYVYDMYVVYIKHIYPHTVKHGLLEIHEHPPLSQFLRTFPAMTTIDKLCSIAMFDQQKATNA